MNIDDDDSFKDLKFDDIDGESSIEFEEIKYDDDISEIKFKMTNSSDKHFETNFKNKNSSDEHTETSFKNKESSDDDCVETYKPATPSSRIDVIIIKIRNFISNARSNFNKVRKEELNKCILKLERAKISSAETKVKLLCSVYISIVNIFTSMRRDKQRIHTSGQIGARMRNAGKKLQAKTLANSNLLYKIYDAVKEANNEVQDGHLNNDRYISPFEHVSRIRDYYCNPEPNYNVVGKSKSNWRDVIRKNFKRVRIPKRKSSKLVEELQVTSKPKETIIKPSFQPDMSSCENFIKSMRARMSEVYASTNLPKPPSFTNIMLKVEGNRGPCPIIVPRGCSCIGDKCIHTRDPHRKEFKKIARKTSRNNKNN
jgi:hypothetical protein